jgi:cellulose synthase/poly-beta-1,6-N-acetylglucosamine synthase-like glycosyltransferase
VIYLAYISGVVLVVRLMIVLSNLISRHWLRQRVPDREPFVSILIPARNEEKNIQQILEDLMHLDYPQVEIIVYDDASEDETATRVKAMIDRGAPVRLIRGVPLPDGWLGKNHACHRLSEEASGAYMLFLDADVRVNKGLLRRSLAHMIKHDLSLLSIFPRQVMHSFGERITVPLMNVILTSMLPMITIRNSFRSSLAAANGQFMMFSARVYRQHQFHRMLRKESVEDIHISRTMKAMGYKVDTLLSSGEVECRMYNGFTEALNGFSRYLLTFFGGSVAGLLLFVLFTTLGVVFVLLGISWQAAVLYMLLSVVLRMMIALISRQSVAWNLLLMPIQQLSLVFMTFEALRRRFVRSNTWKGRNIVLDKK